MNRILLQILLFVCLIIEGYLIIKIFAVSNEIHNALYTGFAIINTLLIIRILNNITNNIYGNDQKN